MTPHHHHHQSPPKKKKKKRRIILRRLPAFAPSIAPAAATSAVMMMMMMMMMTMMIVLATSTAITTTIAIQTNNNNNNNNIQLPHYCNNITSYLLDDCPFQLDGICDHNNDEESLCSSSSGIGQQHQQLDCYDCDPCRQYDYDCEGCTDNNSGSGSGEECVKNV